MAKFRRLSAGRWGRLVAFVLTAAVVASLAAAPGASALVAKKKLAQATLNGSGSTFQLSYDQVTAAEFKQLQPSVTINYAGGGSGKGRQDFSDQVVDYAGTDGLYTAAAASAVKGGAFSYIPTVVAPITVSYNLPSVKKLQLSGDTVAKIFQRKVTTWNDPAIAADNPGVSLPSTPITVVRRADSSGTTQNFTLFLTKAAPSTWTLGTGSTVSWPDGTQGGNGNAGVSAGVKATEGAIGYVDYSDARAAALSFASVKNSAGKFVKPSVKSATASLEGVTLNADLTYDPIYPSGAKAYPITSPTWILVYTNQTDSAKGAALKAWLTYVLTDGQAVATKIDYAPLPKAFAKQALAQVNKIVVP